MGIREHTTYTVECDVCGNCLGHVCITHGGVVISSVAGIDSEHFDTQQEASAVARKAGWTDDTTATKCPKCVGVITRPNWEPEECEDD